MRSWIIVIFLVLMFSVSSGCAARKDFTVLQGGDRKNAEHWYQSGSLFYRVGDYGAAIDYFEKVIAAYPDSIFAHSADKKLKKARKYYDKAVKNY